ncbi:MAG TPA: phasin family protein [Paucimonas sp.]|nr:phasin family protein [Paucimonas sp.]
MPSALNPIMDMCQTQLEASRRLADVVFSGTERIDRVVIDAAHRAVTDQLNFAQAVVATRDPGSIVDLQTTFLSRRPDNAMNYQRELIRVFAEIQSEMGKSMQYYIEQFGSALNVNAAAQARSTQEHANDAMFNPVTGMFSIWETAFREVSSMASRNMEAARASFGSAAESAADTMQKATSVSIDTGEAMATAAAESIEAAADEASSLAARAGDGSGAAGTEERGKAQAASKRR